jgi:hypothetical protein
MTSLLQSLIGRLIPKRLDEQTGVLLERAIDLIDPRLKSFGNYPRAYIPSIIAASDYARQLVAALPESILLSPSKYAQDPLLHALFHDVAAIYSSVHESGEITRYAQEQVLPEGGEVFALMGMRRDEKTVFGREVNGEFVQSDVQQTLVSFSSHTLLLPCGSQEELIAKLEAHFFDSLIRSLATAIDLGVSQVRDLETSRDMLSSRLRGQSPQTEELRVELEKVRQQLASVQHDYELTRYYRIFEAFMDVAPEYLRLEQCEIPIDIRGVMRESSNRLAGRFVFCDLVGRDRRLWTLWPVRLPVDELQRFMRSSSSEESERWMEI